MEICSGDAGLAFSRVGLEDYDRICPYTSFFGEGSCQHSPVSMYSLQEKYGDSVCEDGGFLYTLRRNLCDEKYRVYLAPLGGGDMGRPFLRVLQDARAHGRKARFVTLTEKSLAALEAAFPDGAFGERFRVEERPDLAEYMYLSEKMSAFPGRRLKKRREEVHTFWHMYGDRAVFSRMGQGDFDDVLAYERMWLSVYGKFHDIAALEREARMIELQLASFDRLRLSGVVFRLDGEMAGFCYGTKLSEGCYDMIVEKAERSVPHSYKVLTQETAKQCAADCRLVNMEEDVGIPGLRALKEAYKPEFLLRKFVVTEK